MEIEMGSNFITSEAKVVQKSKKKDDKLLVKFPNGEYAAGENPIDTLIDAIWQIGPENIRRKELVFKDKPIITLSKQFNGQVQVGQNYWLTVPNQTKDKYKMLRIIDVIMKLGLEINIIKEKQAEIFTQILTMKNNNHDVSEISINTDSLENILTRFN